MLPKTHIIVGAIASLLIWLVFPQIGFFWALIIFLSSFLIDVDHYLYYVSIKGDWSLKRAYNWFLEKTMKWRKLNPIEKEKYKRTIMMFHGVEFLLVLVLLVFISRFFLFILLGILIHMALDFIDLYMWQEPLYTKFSQVYVHKRNKNKKEFR